MTIPTLHITDIELPRELEKLYPLAYNLWWSWSPRADELFATIDLGKWALYRNPVQLLINVDRKVWYALLENERFLSLYRTVIDDFEHYLGSSESSWFRRRHASYNGDVIAYFSMEFGLHQSLAIYSGGLGVLSGDHLKSASDLGVPLVAVGLLYRHGYFQQTIDADGYQQHTYPEYDFTRLPLRPVATGTGQEIRIAVPLPGRDVQAKLWLAQVGRVPLILLDTDIPENDPADRPISNILYVNGREMRLVQELMLGIGGVKALSALGIEPTVWHLNEGHSAFLQLERLRERVRDHGADFEAAIRDIARSSVFTTHTPVEAGNERFDSHLIRKYLRGWCDEAGAPMDRLLALGRAHEGEDAFNLTTLGIRTSEHYNGVSQLNAEVTNRMWQHVLAERGDAERRIIAITNGVHTPSWIGPELRQLLLGLLGPDWESMLLAADGWEKIHQLSDADLWNVHMAQKRRLGRFSCSRLRDQLARYGSSPDELRAVTGLFNANSLTVGFARRFATYKRADLIFRDFERLKAMVSDASRPVQFIFAGKAHPADRPGQELIQHIFRLSRGEENLAGKVFFLENYDMRMGRMLVQGVDVWLNTPRRPYEASGTSGMKAALNGVLNFSILDGWWPEGYDGDNGWVIGQEQEYANEDEQDRIDVESLYETLGSEILPLYYDRDADGLPRQWIAKMKASIATLTWKFSASRMLGDYVEKCYLPAGQDA